jgi:hypothetical protein
MDEVVVNDDLNETRGGDWKALVCLPILFEGTEEAGIICQSNSSQSGL